MSYYGQGDYYQGDYYQGDPFWGAIAGAAGSLLGKIFKRKPTVRPAVMPAPRTTQTALIRRPQTGMVPAAGTASRWGGLVRRAASQLPGIGAGLALPGMIDIAIPAPGGGTIRPGRILPGGQPFYTPPPTRRRRMNVANPKALRRSLRRVSGFAKLAQRAKRDIRRAAVAAGATTSRSSGRRPACRCGQGGHTIVQN